MSAPKDAKGERPAPPKRADFRHFTAISSRWMDNDLYGHINNTVYYSFFDTAIADYLMREGGLDPWKSPVIGYAVENACRFHAAMRYPDIITGGVAVTRLGRTSVRYAIGLFRNDDDQAAASGHFVHVFVDRQKERPAEPPAQLRAALEKIVVV